MLFHLYRVLCGRKETPPDKREYRVWELEESYGRSPVGTIQEIADFIQGKLKLKEFSLEIYDPISEPDRNQRIEFRKNETIGHNQFHQ